MSSSPLRAPRERAPSRPISDEERRRRLAAVAAVLEGIRQRLTAEAAEAAEREQPAQRQEGGSG